MPLLFNMLSRLMIAFLPRSKQASFNFMAAVTMHSHSGAPQNKVSHCFLCFPIYLPGSNGTRYHDLYFSSVQFSSVAQSCPTLCDPMDCSMPGLPVLHQPSRVLLTLMSIKSVMPSNHLILCCPLLLLPSTLPSISVFSNEWVLLIRWPKYWSFSFSISPSNEYLGLIFFRIDWFDLLAVQGTLTTVQKHQFFSAHLSLWSNSHIQTWLLEKS